MITTIFVTAGAQEYVGGTITETSGKDISVDACQIGLSSVPGVPPTQWHTPDSDTVGATTATRILKMLVTSSNAVGWYSCWVQVVDAPEILPMVVQDGINLV